MTQTILAIFMPTLAVLVGILLNRNDVGRLDGRISALETRLDARISNLESGIGARLTALENRMHADMMLIMGKLTELEGRVARLEQEQER